MKNKEKENEAREFPELQSGINNLHVFYPVLNGLSCISNSALFLPVCKILTSRNLSQTPSFHTTHQQSSKEKCWKLELEIRAESNLLVSTSSKVYKIKMLIVRPAVTMLKNIKPTHRIYPWQALTDLTASLSFPVFLFSNDSTVAQSFTPSPPTPQNLLSFWPGKPQIHGQGSRAPSLRCPTDLLSLLRLHCTWVTFHFTHIRILLHDFIRRANLC